ncbi:MAG: hypothetical protein A3B37_00075 [Candidatus Sungbacteria bacterium RIFCSPLOWO2_01_FULL_59_16]|uniref:Ribose 5-phosphate isomerase B n=1 Tax=Candidatus Sungbacteria bacterium RIFCSPLOWO2_01_FULL_59_16 TaxID=1802280 RepID=A0A1G2LA44_9BACT|nr:MAG: hypothetical protein A3B37_00075 [Candidatus Sungbacteria bacterium RIFCSPLOWO2_01_FULL_59_16]
MKIFLGADHRGFELKEKLKRFLASHGYEVEDVGAASYESTDDYPDFGRAAIEGLRAEGGGAFAILICGSGHGMDILANKHRGIRAALCFNASIAKQSREHEDANALILPSDWVTEEQAIEIIRAWSDAEFRGEARHVRRLKKIEEIEEENFK